MSWAAVVALLEVHDGLVGLPLRSGICRRWVLLICASLIDGRPMSTLKEENYYSARPKRLKKKRTHRNEYNTRAQEAQWLQTLLWDAREKESTNHLLSLAPAPHHHGDPSARFTTARRTPPQTICQVSKNGLCMGQKL